MTVRNGNKVVEIGEFGCPAISKWTGKKTTNDVAATRMENEKMNDGRHDMMMSMCDWS